MSEFEEYFYEDDDDQPIEFEGSLTPVDGADHGEEIAGFDDVHDANPLEGRLMAGVKPWAGPEGSSPRR